jgi:hypothetical protein
MRRFHGLELGGAAGQPVADAAAPSSSTRRVSTAGGLRRISLDARIHSPASPPGSCPGRAAGQRSGPPSAGDRRTTPPPHRGGQIELEALRLYGLPEAAPALLCGTPTLPVGQREFAAETTLDLPSLAAGAAHLVDVAVPGARQGDRAEASLASSARFIELEARRHHGRGDRARRLGGLGLDDACGYRAIAGLLVEARRRGLAARRLALCNSGDVPAGSRGRVVGYGAWEFEEAAR